MRLVVFLIIACLPGITGAKYLPDAWYFALAKPWWNPPPWVFAPAWTALYCLIGIAAWRAWIGGAADPARRWRAFVPFAVQLVLNALWSPIFFGARQPGWALVEVALLWLGVVWTWRSLRSLDSTAGWLLAPYVAWVSFAAVLNAAIVTLNGWAPRFGG